MSTKCPRCGKETVFKGNRFRPFCSERCRLIDLGHWVSGDYGIPAAGPEADEETDDGAKPPGNSSKLMDD